MKKVLTLTLIAAILFGACDKEENHATQGQTPNRVIALYNDAKTGNSPFMLIMNMRHNNKDSKGSRGNGKIVA